MKITVIALALITTSCATCLPRPDRSADIAALEESKLKTWPSLYRSQDADGLDDFLADDFVLIGGESDFTVKADEVAWLRNNAWNGPADFRYEIERIVFQGDDGALVYGRGISTRTDAETGAPCKHVYISSNTFRRDNGVWQPVASHVSDASCTPLSP